jgi:hypothetical protein
VLGSDLPSNYRRQLMQHSKWFTPVTPALYWCYSGVVLQHMVAIKAGHMLRLGVCCGLACVANINTMAATCHVLSLSGLHGSPDISDIIQSETINILFIKLYKVSFVYKTCVQVEKNKKTILSKNKYFSYNLFIINNLIQLFSSVLIFFSLLTELLTSTKNIYYCLLLSKY